MTPVIEVDHVSKQFRLYHERYGTLKERVVRLRRQTFEPFWALREVSLNVDDSETLGLIGANGSGKTTLLKIIAGILRPTSGVLRRRGRVAALLELGAGFHPDLTGRENVYMNASILGLSKRETDKRFDEMVAFAELEPFIDNQVKHYSSGMYVRLGFAVAVHVDPEILLVDEVLAVGDEAFQRKCLDKVRQFQREGRTIVFVTHAVDLVREICNRAACLHEGRVIAVGQVPEVVRAFRETLHGEAHLEAAPLEERGTREFRIVSVALRDDGGGRRQVFHAGEDLEVVVDAEADLPLDDPVGGIEISDARGNVLFGTNTARRQIDLGTVQGKVRLRFLLRQIPFMDGTYSVTVGLHSRDERTVYHWQERAHQFRCVNVGADSGPLQVPCELEVERL